MNKDKRIPIRVTQEEKEIIASSAKKENMTTSEYLRCLVLEDTASLSHEKQIENAMLDNQLLNNLLVHPEIPNNVKKIIGKELRNYV